MKKFITALMILTSGLFCNAQLVSKEYNPYENELQPIELNYTIGSALEQESKWDKWRPWVQKAVMVTSVVLEAKGDAEYDEGNKKTGKLYQAASLATFATLIPLHEKGDKVLVQGISYICIRAALFDPVYNVTRNLPIGYIGTTSYYDDVVRAFEPPVGMQLFGRAVALTAGVTIKF